MLQMVAPQFPTNAAARFVDCRDLREDVRAISVGFDHLLQSAHLTLDAAQSLQIAILGVGVDRDRFSAFLSREKELAAAPGKRCRRTAVLLRCNFSQGVLRANV